MNGESSCIRRRKGQWPGGDVPQAPSVTLAHVRWGWQLGCFALTALPHPVRSHCWRPSRALAASLHPCPSTPGSCLWFCPGRAPWHPSDLDTCGRANPCIWCPGTRNSPAAPRVPDTCQRTLLLGSRCPHRISGSCKVCYGACYADIQEGLLA